MTETSLPSTILTPPTQSTEQIEYDSLILNRKQLFQKNRLNSLQGYTIQPIALVPTGTPIQSLSVTECCSHFYLGGSDGFIRRYNLHSMLNGIGFNENNNLIMKYGLISLPEAKAPLLINYWENELNLVEGKEKEKFGTKVSQVGESIDIVYSLAVQSQDLFGLSGTAHGTINLFGIRHDEGQIRHIFKSSPTPSQGHLPNSPISVLLLSPDEKSFLSGGWDSNILLWDLNTGKVRKRFTGHVGQISSISFRPESRGEGEVRSPTSSEKGVEASLLVKGEKELEEAKEKEKFDSLSPKSNDSLFNDSEKDADGDIDLPPPTTTPLPTKAKKDFIPLWESKNFEKLSTGQYFLSTSFDGMVLLWDFEGDDGPRRLGEEGRKSCTTATWSVKGDQIYVARKNSSFDIFNLKSSSPVKTFTLPTVSGPITQIIALDENYLITASVDCLRLWDLRKTIGLSWRIISGGQGGTIATLYLDPTRRFLFSTSGNRGYEGETADSLVIYEVIAK